MKNFKPLVASSVIVILLWVLSFPVLNKIFDGSEATAHFGDSFGAVNALFSGLAFAGIIATIWLQKNELALQREELKMTREELKKSAQAQDKTQYALNSQVGLMTNQALLNAYQTKFSSNIELLASKTGSQGQRTLARAELTELLTKTASLISELEIEKELWDTANEAQIGTPPENATNK